MGKRVLVAVDINSQADSSVHYGIQLAARIKSPMALLVTSPSAPRRGVGVPQLMPGQVDREEIPWMDSVLEECRRAGVNLEIFFGSDPFFEEVTRFVSSQPSVQFVVMAAPTDSHSEGGSTFASQLKRLHRAFEGEILLVQKAGHVTRVSNMNLHSSVRETS